MSKIGDIFRSVGKFLMQAELPLSAQPVPELQVGMKWLLKHHHKYNFDDGFVVKCQSSFQVVDVDDEYFELQERGKYRDVFRRDDWARIYENNFAGRQDASGIAGGGYIEPVYLGIYPVPEDKFKSYITLTYLNESLLAVKDHGRKSTSYSEYTSALRLPE